MGLAATLTLQSEWVLYPFLSIAANANALCERAIKERHKITDLILGEQVLIFTSG